MDNRIDDGGPAFPVQPLSATGEPMMESWAGMSVLDVCCGSRMFWFDKDDTRTTFIDKRRENHSLTDSSSRSGKRALIIDPDLIADFTDLPFPENRFAMVVFDPPHLIKSGRNSWLAKKYGKLGANWEPELRQGFAECFRVLKPEGALIFKWNETDIPVSQVLALTEVKPLFGNKCGKLSKSHWLVFMKPILSLLLLTLSAQGGDEFAVAKTDDGHGKNLRLALQRTKIVTGKLSGSREINQPGLVRFQPTAPTLIANTPTGDNSKAGRFAAPGSDFIYRIGQIESGMDSSKVGDGGKAIGAFQLTERAVNDVNRLRRNQGLPEVDWEMCADLGTGGEVARQYVGILNRQLHTALRRFPSESELLSAYQLGFHGFKARGFNVPQSIKRKLTQ